MLSLDNYYEIAHWITEGSTWKSWLFTCKAFAAMNSREKKLEFADELATLYKAFPKGDWDYYILFARGVIPIEKFYQQEDWEDFLIIGPEYSGFDLSQKNMIYDRIPLEFVKEHPEIDCFYRCISNNSSTTWEMVRDSPEIKWDFEVLSNNPNITVEIVKENRREWNWETFSVNESVTPEIVKANLELPWCWDTLTRNPNFTMETFRQWPELLTENLFGVYPKINRLLIRHISGAGLWDKKTQSCTIQEIRSSPRNIQQTCFSINQDVTMESVDENREFLVELFGEDAVESLREKLVKEWRWRDESSFTFDYLLANIDLPWDSNRVSKMQFTWDQIESLRQKNWDYGELSNHSQLTLARVLSLPDKKWDYAAVLRNPAISLEELVNYFNSGSVSKKMESNSEYVFCNPNVTFDLPGDIFDMNWNIPNLSENSSMTIEHILQDLYLDWDWYALSLNPSITWIDIVENPDFPWKTREFGFRNSPCNHPEHENYVPF